MPKTVELQRNIARDSTPSVGGFRQVQSYHIRNAREMIV